MSNFEDRLLTELKREVAHAAEHAAAGAEPEPARRPARGVRRAGWGLAMAGAVAAALVLLPGGGASPAYAVASDGAGGIEVRLSDWPDGDEEIESFLAELAAAGVTPVHDPPAGYQCRPFPDGVFFRSWLGSHDETSAWTEADMIQVGEALGGAILVEPEEPHTGSSSAAYSRSPGREFPRDAVYRLSPGDTVVLVDKPQFGAIAFVEGACAPLPGAEE
ncbi:hypothetical protein [Streptomyces profundus]|uniref:hypothetical protein n=1 Tax=Streptomyces profundus TaxID=2867410 RepID=UPI001D15F733|nr:hypothetical protein [Streptomyces sp. MA3_2.13]UED83660.1 hypothetical protein K4G22_05085 [Streptomyces sp. MA3_2.13]